MLFINFLGLFFKDFIIEKLDKFNIDDDVFLAKSCEFCQNNYSIGERIAILRCTHIIHTNCLLSHLAINDTYLCFECEEEIFNQEDLSDYFSKKEDLKITKSQNQIPIEHDINEEMNNNESRSGLN